MAHEPNESEFVIPDTPESLVTARFYRKEAQVAMINALEASRGRSGLSQQEKIEQMKQMQAFLTTAQECVTNSLALMEA